MANSTDGSCIFEQTYIPDYYFESALIDLGYDTYFDDSVSTPRIDTIITLNIDSANISDLTGIEDFIALEYLYCAYSPLTSLDVTNNLALIYLNVAPWDSPGNLTSLDISQNTSLQYLYCNNNQLTSLDVSSNTDLASLICGANQLTSLDVSSNKSLSALDCSNNQLSTLDIRNGNNINMWWAQTAINPNLTCINVDNEKWSSIN